MLHNSRESEAGEVVVRFLSGCCRRYSTSMLLSCLTANFILAEVAGLSGRSEYLPDIGGKASQAEVDAT